MTLSASLMKGVLLVLLLMLVLWWGIDSTSKPTRDRNQNEDFVAALAQFADSSAPINQEPLVFPRDHGIHRRSGIESWQIGGLLKTSKGEPFGFESTWGRIDLDTDLRQRRSAWATDQIFHLDHALFAFNSGETLREDKTGRDALGLSGYDARQHKIRVYARELVFHEPGANSDIELNIPDGSRPIKLSLRATKPMIMLADTGPFRYYAITRMQASGTLGISGENQPVSGQAYFEHRWGKFPTGRGQLIQNRLILQLSNGIDLNVLESRRRDGTGKPIASALMVLANGESIALEPGDMEVEPKASWTSSKTALRYPLRWNIRIPERSIALDVQAWSADQETPDSPVDWAGMLSVSGRDASGSLVGFGYAQLSGY